MRAIPILFLLSSGVLAQGAWVQLAPVVPWAAPPGRFGHPLAFDAARERFVTLGGSISTFAVSTFPPNPDTLEFGPAGWNQMASSGPALTGHSMAYDPIRDRTVVFGGQYAVGISDSTWEWDGNSWTYVAAPTRPPATHIAPMVWHGGRQKVVLFVGSSTFPATLWEFDGVTWAQIPTPAGGTLSGLGFGASMVYEPSTDRLILFGGVGPWGASGQTWIWSEQAGWSQWNIVNGPTPPGRVRAGFVYDARRGKAILFGGAQSLNGAGPLSDLWEWSGGFPGSWTPVLAVGPLPRSGFAMAYDDSRGTVLIHGGQFGTASIHWDTWEYRPPTSVTGQANSAAASLVVNGLGSWGGPGPFHALVVGTGMVSATLTGPPGMPYIVASGTLTPSLATPCGFIDIGPLTGLTTLADGTQNPVFALDAAGQATVVVPVPALASGTPLGDFQAAVLQPPGSGCPLTPTAAWRVSVR